MLANPIHVRAVPCSTTKTHTHRVTMGSYLHTAHSERYSLFGTHKQTWLNSVCNSSLTIYMFVVTCEWEVLYHVWLGSLWWSVSGRRFINGEVSVVTRVLEMPSFAFVALLCSVTWACRLLFKFVILFCCWTPRSSWTNALAEWFPAAHTQICWEVNCYIH